MEKFMGGSNHGIIQQILIMVASNIRITDYQSMHPIIRQPITGPCSHGRTDLKGPIELWNNTLGLVSIYGTNDYGSILLWKNWLLVYVIYSYYALPCLFTYYYNHSNLTVRHCLFIMSQHTQSNWISIKFTRTQSHSVRRLSLIEYGNRTQPNSHKNNWTNEFIKHVIFELLISVKLVLKISNKFIEVQVSLVQHVFLTKKVDWAEFTCYWETP